MCNVTGHMTHDRLSLESNYLTGWHLNYFAISESRLLKKRTTASEMSPMHFIY